MNDRVYRFLYVSTLRARHVHDALTPFMRKK